MNVVVSLIVVGVLLWLVNTYIPMDAKINRILNIVVVIAVVIWLLQAFGLLGALNGIRIGHWRRYAPDRKSAEYHRSEKSTGDPSGQKTLSELGISKPDSSDWQKLADIPDEDFEGKEHVFYWIGFCNVNTSRTRLTAVSRSATLQRRFKKGNQKWRPIYFSRKLILSLATAVFAAATIEFIGEFNVWWAGGFPGTIMVFVNSLLRKRMSVSSTQSLLEMPST
jgi:hypothetical protein